MLFSFWKDLEGRKSLLTKKYYYDEERCKKYKKWPVSKPAVAVIVMAILGVVALLSWFVALLFAVVVAYLLITSSRTRGSSKYNYGGSASQKTHGKKVDDDFVVDKRICEISKRYCRGEKPRQIAEDLRVSIASVKRGIKKAKKENIIGKE
ncbi:hypothetical protein AKJ41_02110 [candidate division MSBL1 archaeon SCGC-AAA259O05]|uniref:Uncharacterized protein n=1 Tax=candidate division MSBL1 archaeon SCGC-AAA259O05 TaxID=1698271 RepID=A0A133V4A6_9EURY|nr:hypothetical protein AKJ41_02110 [candidate division MSBL1 archaeon SCGC-AAA259O05]